MEKSTLWPKSLDHGRMPSFAISCLTLGRLDRNKDNGGKQQS